VRFIGEKIVKFYAENQEIPSSIKLADNFCVLSGTNVTGVLSMKGLAMIFERE
jgi:hypothetical protein